MKISDMTSLLIPQKCIWEEKKSERLVVERAFENYTGVIRTVELHVPYTKWKYLFKMMEEDKKIKGKKMLLSAGDSLNLDMFSFFYHRSSVKTFPELEVAQLIEFLKQASDVYDEIVFLKSNHEHRFEKIVSKFVPDREQAENISKFIYTLNDIFERNDLSNIVNVDGPFVMIGDAVFSHYENNSSTPGTVPRWVIQYLTPRIQKPWSVCFQAHTHHQSKTLVDRKVVVEPGALCGTLDYWRSGKLVGKGKMSSVGYAECEMKNGKANLNKCNPIFCEWEDYL